MTIAEDGKGAWKSSWTGQASAMDENAILGVPSSPREAR